MQAFIFLMAFVWATPVVSQTQSLVEIPSRPNISITAVLVTPVPPPPILPLGAVILLAGDNGRLDIIPDSSGGFQITKLAGNQLVRTRDLYAQAGFLTLVPDLAPDLKVGANDVIPEYRIGKPHALDIGAMVSFMRAQMSGPPPFGGGPVIVIGTSMGSISAANAAANLTGLRRPNRVVVTSPFYLTRGQLSIMRAVDNNAAKLGLPMLAVSHSADTCQFTLPSDLPVFMRWYRGSGRELSVEILSLGGPFTGNICDAEHAHGFKGLDRLVVWKITTWIMRQSLPAP